MSCKRLIKELRQLSKQLREHGDTFTQRLDNPRKRKYIDRAVLPRLDRNINKQWEIVEKEIMNIRKKHEKEKTTD